MLSSLTIAPSLEGHLHLRRKTNKSPSSASLPLIYRSRTASVMAPTIRVHNILHVFRSLQSIPLPSPGHSCPRKRPFQQLIKIPARGVWKSGPKTCALSYGILVVCPNQGAIFIEAQSARKPRLLDFKNGSYWLCDIESSISQMQCELNFPLT